MSVPVPEEMAKGYREQEILRLFHNNLAVKIVKDSSSEYDTWKSGGYKVSSVPTSLSLEQFREWQTEWFKPTQEKISAIVAPLREILHLAEAEEQKIDIEDVDIESIKLVLKESTLYDGEINLDSIKNA